MVPKCIFHFNFTQEGSGFVIDLYKFALQECFAKNEGLVHDVMKMLFEFFHDKKFLSLYEDVVHVKPKALLWMSFIRKHNSPPEMFNFLFQLNGVCAEVNDHNYFKVIFINC